MLKRGTRADVPRRLKRGLVLAVAATMLGGCSLGEVRSLPTDTSNELVDRVARVIDGDTVILKGLGRSRIIGIDTPEIPDGCGARLAQERLRQLVQDRVVRVRRGREPTDRYGRALVYLYRPGDARSIGILLAEQGLARPLRIPPNIDEADAIAAAATHAKVARRGLWSPRCA